MRCDDKSGSAARAARPKTKPPAHRIGSASQQRIGVHLQAMYQRVLSQPVPDRFIDLIARLEVESRLQAEGPDRDEASLVPEKDGEPSPESAAASREDVMEP